MSEIEYHHYEHTEDPPAHIRQALHQRIGVPPRRHAGQQRVANPDDPPVLRPPRGPHGPLPGPRELGVPGRIAIVQGQIFIVATILIAQLWLVTDALFELLSGHAQVLGWLTLASGVGFAIALVVWLWPSRRTQGL